MQKKYRLLLQTIWAWALLIMMLSLLPRMSSLTNPHDENGINQGPLAHLGAYAVLAALLSSYLIITESSHPAVKGALIAGAYGALVECAQYLIPYRSFDIYDILLNLAAAVLGTIFIKLLK